MSGKYIPKNFSIATLFPTQDGSKPYVNGKLDINSLFGNAKHEEFNSSDLLDASKKRKKKLQLCYNELYDTCCKSIKLVNDSGMTDMIFTVSTYVPECPDYNSVDCLKFIKERLTDQLLDTKIISYTELFITWYNLEMRLRQEKSKRQK